MTDTEKILDALRKVYKQNQLIMDKLGIGETANGKKEYKKVPVDTAKSVVRGMGHYKGHTYPVLHVPTNGGPLIALHDGTNQFRVKRENIELNMWQKEVPWNEAVNAKFNEATLFGIETREEDLA